MKPKKQQLPKARVMFCHQELANPYAEMRREKNEFYPHPVAVIPTPTAKQAKALAAFFNLSEGEQVEVLAKALLEPVTDGLFTWSLERSKPAVRLGFARAVLRRIKG